MEIILIKQVGIWTLQFIFRNIHKYYIPAYCLIDLQPTTPEGTKSIFIRDLTFIPGTLIYSILSDWNLRRGIFLSVVSLICPRHRKISLLALGWLVTIVTSFSYLATGRYFIGLYVLGFFISLFFSRKMLTLVLCCVHMPRAVLNY